MGSLGFPSWLCVAASLPCLWQATGAFSDGRAAWREGVAAPLGLRHLEGDRAYFHLFLEIFFLVVRVKN